MTERRQMLIIILLVINAVLICCFGILVVKQLNEKYDMLSSHVISINNSSVHYLENNITERIKNELDERYNLVEMTDYKFARIDADNNQAILDFTVKLKAVSANSRIYMVFSEMNTNNVQEVELVKKDSLTYGASVELNLQKNYQYDVIERVDGGGQALLNTYRQYINLYDQFYVMRVQFHDMGTVRSDKQVEFNFSFSVNDFGMEDESGLESAMLEILYNNEVIDRIDITNSLMKVTGDNELQARYNLAIASGEIDPGLSLEDFMKYIGFEPEENSNSSTRYTYIHRINYNTDYPELQLNKDKAGDMRFNVVITCRDGYRFAWE